MLAAEITLPVAVGALSGALLIGLLVGVQRESSGAHPGLRDFLLISLAGGISGLLDNAWLGGAALLSITALLALFRFEERKEGSGVTTDLAGVATFVLAYLAASRQLDFAAPLAIGITIVVAIFLEAKQRLHSLVREQITEAEFNGTLAFVAFVLVVYPLLPRGSYGPFSFFQPRQVWLFVILILSLSYVGFFLEKFLGEEEGLFYTSVLGGLTSTTAATLHFARVSKERPEETFGLWRAFVVANTVQFPRTLLIVALVHRELALACVWPLAAMTLCGVILAEILRRWPHERVSGLKMTAGNPFRLGPALRFGALFTAVVFLTKAATAKLGTDAFYGTSLFGGLVDVATVVAPAADFLRSQEIPVQTAEIAVLLALVSNAALKIVLAAMTGTVSFTLRITATLALWAGAAAATWWIGFRV